MEGSVCFGLVWKDKPGFWQRAMVDSLTQLSNLRVEPRRIIVREDRSSTLQCNIFLETKVTNHIEPGKSNCN